MAKERDIEKIMTLTGEKDEDLIELLLDALYSREWYRHSGIRWNMSLCWKRCSAGLQDHLY